MSNTENAIASSTPTTDDPPRDAAQDLLIEQWSRGTAASSPVPPEQFPTEAPLANTSLSPSASSDIGAGLALMVVGIIITVVTYNAAAGGGVYVVAWGPVIFGFLRLMRGLTR